MEQPAPDDPATRDTAVRLHLTVLRCQVGDEQAFAALFAQFGRHTLRHLQSLIGDDAEDAQQELWLGVYRRVRDLAHPRAFRTWLFRSTRHRAIDHLRRQRRERELFLDNVPLEAIVDHVSSGPDEMNDPVALEAMLTSLAPLHREAIVLRHLEELSYADIALVTGAPIGTVRSRLHHAREQLRQLWDEPEPVASVTSHQPKDSQS